MPRSRHLVRAWSSFVVALVVPACLEAGDGRDDGASAAESALVGGTSTTLRSEIGQFFNGNGGVCTATLIAPRVVITAAHCLSPEDTGTIPFAGTVFQITTPSGLTNFGIDRIVSFSTKRYEYAPGNLGSTDVALLRLSAPVPSSVVPAAVSLNPPALGARSTMFGFGCTDRITGVGGGSKQFFSFNAGSPTTALCWGDSGGPDVFGDPGDNGAIWGVNSDFNVLPSIYPAFWTDVFGAVTFYKHQIESVMRQWNGDLELGMDRAGMDSAAPDFDPTAAACSLRCAKDGGCRSFAWVASSGSCFRKFAVPGLTPASGGAVTSGLAPVFETTTNRNGMDLLAVARPSAESCAMTCGTNELCRAWTFTSDGVCYLKNGIPAASFCGNCTSGVFDRSLEPNTDRNGGDLRAVSAATARECSKSCAADSSCLAYTFIGGTTNNCFLKGSAPGPSWSPGSTSGLKKGLQAQANRPGGDIPFADFETPVLSPNVCQAACANDTRCQAWTYTVPPPLGTQGHCWLKNSIPGAVFDSGSVSGIRGLEFLP